MEIAIVILSALLLICCGTSLIVMNAINKTMKKERIRFDKLAESVFDYQMEWSEDLSYIHFGENLKKLLVNCGIKPDKNYIIDVFYDQNGSRESGISLCVNALRKSGVISPYCSADGTAGLIQWKSVSVSGKDGKLLIYSLGRDISSETVMRRVTDRLRDDLLEEFGFMQTASANAETGILSIIVEGESVFIKTAPRFCSLWGFPNTDTILLEQLFSVMKKEDILEFQHNLDCFLSGLWDFFSATAAIKTVYGHYHVFTMECGYNKGVTDYRHLRTGMIFDITANRISIDISRRNDHRDAITGLYDRSGFMTEGDMFLKRCNENNKPAVLVCLQVQRLRKISILFGIEMSDTLARLYAETLTSLTDKSAVIGKVGIEDYALLTECGDKETVENLLKKLSIIIENCCNNETLPSVLKEQSGFKAGACFYLEGDDIAALYNKASVTLFNGTESPGTVCSYFDSEVETKVCGRDIVEHEIGEALNSGELELYYQPKVDINTEKIIGAEALMRWNHKTQGLIMPGEFIHIAEEIGIIAKIDEWGMLQACMQNKIWQEKGYNPIKISVNMSQAQLYQTDVVASVKNALEVSGISPSCLEVELTETMAMIDIDRTISILNSLKQLGVSISMDDFGTGYSSLSSLKILPIDLLKIDRSLVYDIETNKTARCITKAIVELGKAMNLTILAEGVENNNQRDILRELGCDVIQGFLYSKPQPAAVIEKNFLIPAMREKEKVQ